MGGVKYKLTFIWYDLMSIKSIYIYNFYSPLVGLSPSNLKVCIHTDNYKLQWNTQMLIAVFILTVNFIIFVLLIALTKFSVMHLGYIDDKV